jgi:hypothetical protein
LENNWTGSGFAWSQAFLYLDPVAMEKIFKKRFILDITLVDRRKHLIILGNILKAGVPDPLTF